MRKQLVKRPDLPKAAPGHLTGDTAVMPRKLMLQLLCMTAGLTLSAWGHAVGLGGINVISALGQPLKAEIELEAVGQADKPSLVARLASPETYKAARLDYPIGVKYSFKIESRANGEPYLVLSSNREIKDPFVSLLVELSWASGRLMREYTFLLDPPGYVATQPKSTAVLPVAPAVEQSPSLNATGEKPEAANRAVRAVENTVKPEQVEAGTVIVKSGDYLNKIATLNKPADISLERMLVALYRANADQFDGKNMNRIQSGKILRVPDRDEINGVGQAEAVHEIHAQVADWNAYRQKLAGAASTSRKTESTRQVATGKVTAPAVDKTPVASESSKEVLRLSKGEAPGKKIGAAGRSAQQNAAAEDAIAKAKAVEEGSTRAALLDANLKDMQRLAQLKSEAAALIASAAASKAGVAASSAVAAVSQVAASSAVGAASQVTAASAVKPAGAVSFVDWFRSFFDQPLGLFIALSLVAAAVLGSLGIVFLRRKKPSENVNKLAESEPGATTVHLINSVEPALDLGDFTAKPIAAEEIAPHPDDVDPIKEAELFLNFGRDEQAEEVLKDALLRSPDNHKIHLKLLGIYAKRQDVAAFSEVASLLEESGDIDAIRRAEALAQKLEPASISAMQLPAVAEQEEAAVATAEHADVTKSPVSQEELTDFDVTSLPVQTAVEDFEATQSSPLLAAPEVLDFDIAAEPEPEDEALPNLDDLIFDVTSSNEVPAKVDSSAEKTAEEDDGMAFTLDFPMDDIEDKTLSQPPAINLADISLDMDDVSTPVAEAAATDKNEHWHEVATKLDLARAYQEMGDDVGSREILDEVMLEGDEAQQQEAQLLIKQLT